MDVEPEVAHGGTDDDRAEQGQVRLVGHVEQSDDHVGDEGKRGRAAGQAVQAVGDVHAVAGGDDGEGGEDDPEWGPDHDIARERHPDRIDVEVLLDVQRGKDGDDDLTDQLLEVLDAVARRDVQVVVEGAQGSHAKQGGQR